MSIPLCFWLEEVALNLTEELFQRWSYKVAFGSAHNEADLELISFFLWRHQRWSCIQHHYCLYKLSCWSSQAFKLHTSMGWEDDIVKGYLYYIMYFYWISCYRDSCGAWLFCLLEKASTTIARWPLCLFSVEFGYNLSAVTVDENMCSWLCTF